MDFSYSEEQTTVRELARQIIADHSKPEQLREIEQQPQRLDQQLWRELANAGLLGVAIDDAYGGMGYGFESLCLLVEEAGRHVAAAPVVPVLVSAASTLQRFAHETLKQRYLPGVASGEHLLSAALAEPGNTDPAAPHCRAEEIDGQWRLTGRKHCVPFAAQSVRLLVTARAGDELVALLVDPQAAGVSMASQAVTAGETQYEITFDGAVTDEIVARGERAETLAQWLGDITAVAYAMMATGLCDQMLRMTASYTSERRQFGVPVATFQAVGHRAAEAFIDIECLRLASQQAVSLLDQDLDAREAVQVARIWTGDVTHRVSQSAQHLHGGMGVDRDYPLFRYCLWARQIELTVGSSAASLAALGETIAGEFLSMTA